MPRRPAATPDRDRLGGTLKLGDDLVVDRLGFGAMRLTGPGSWGELDPEKAGHVLRRAVDLGITLIDTADACGPEVSESRIAETLHPYPEGLVIATKGGVVRPWRERWDPDCRPQHLRGACEASLKRLKLERIDLHQLHTVDRCVPLEDSVGALADLKTQGKIRHIGLSNVSVEELRRARAIVPIEAVQNRFNHTDRSSDDVLVECEREGIAFLPWGPLGAGNRGEMRGLARIATRTDATPVQLGIAWLLARSPVMLPIPGTSSVAHLEENVAAARLRLLPDDLAALSA